MKTFYHVAPRYSSGSPAMVSEEVATQVARDEREAWDRYVEGVYGDREKDRAEFDGKQGIVYSSAEKRGQIHISDLITGEIFIVPIKDWVGNRWHSRNDRDKFKVSV